jgi:hypothetical protein
MKKFTILFVLAMLFNASLTFAQSRNPTNAGEMTKIKLKKNYQLATGFFVFPFPASDFGVKYNEFLWNSRAGFYLNKNFVVGLMTNFAYAKPENQPHRFFYAVGPHLNYRIVDNSGDFCLYFETGYNFSNHHIPDEGLPRSLPTHYVNYGGGINIKLKKDVYLDAAVVLQDCVGNSKKCGGSSSIFRVGIETVIR